MDKCVANELDKCYNKYKGDPASKRIKAVTYLVLQAYVPKNAKTRPERLDPKFRKFSISKIHLFMFADYDSTSSTICYIFYILATNPNDLAQVRTEHNKVLGTKLSEAPSMLKEQPHLQNHLLYTTAIIQEAAAAQTNQISTLAMTKAQAALRNMLWYYNR